MDNKKLDLTKFTFSSYTSRQLNPHSDYISIFDLLPNSVYPDYILCMNQEEKDIIEGTLLTLGKKATVILYRDESILEFNTDMKYVFQTNSYLHYSRYKENKKIILPKFN